LRIDASRWVVVWAFLWPVLLAVSTIISQIGPAAAQTASEDSLRLAPSGLTTSVPASDPSYLELGQGVYDILGDHGNHETFATDAEFHFGEKIFSIGPAIGVIADARGGGMVYAALYSDIAVGPFVVTPLAGIGGWWKGAHNDENLGGPFEFRLSLQTAYQFDGGSRLGVRFGHISSAGINKRNPGENDLMLTYGLPLSL